MSTDLLYISPNRHTVTNNASTRNLVLVLLLMDSVQNDLDSFIVACYHGHRRLVCELITKYKMNQHIVNEVCVCVCVCVCV